MEETPEMLFLDWCKDNNLVPISNGPHQYRFEIVAVRIKGGFEFSNINAMQDNRFLDVNFKEDGTWAGGSSIIWNTELPWQADA